jgi:hypothetical protein
MTLSDYSNTSKRTAILLETNDPKMENIALTAHATCKAPFNANPAYIDFGRVSTAAVKGLTRTIEVRSEIEAVGESGEWQVNSLRHLVGLRRLQESSTGVTLSVAIPPNVRAGDIFDSIEVRKTACVHVIKIPVRAQLLEGITAAPSVAISSNNMSGVESMLRFNEKEFDWHDLRILGEEPQVKLAAVSPIAQNTFRIVLEPVLDGWRRRTQVLIGFDEINAATIDIVPGATYIGEGAGE